MDFGVIKGRQITMICFAEYACYVHLNGDHLRIESNSTFITDAGEYELFPKVDNHALGHLLGKSILRVDEISDALVLETEDGTLRTQFNEAYESVMLVIDGEMIVR